MHGHTALYISMLAEGGVMRGQSVVYQTLDRLGIAYQVVEHEPAFTVAEMERIAFPADAEIAKNLFLRDAKGRRHFLVTAAKSLPVDLRGMEERLGTTRLSFASEERLRKYLGLGKGSVSPFGILNDEGRVVEVVFDRSLAGTRRVGVHPNDNSATLLLAFDDIVRVAWEHGNSVQFIGLGGPASA